MVAPGANFDIYEGPYFKARTKGMAEFVAAVEDHVRDHFDRYKLIDLDTRQGEMLWQGTRFGIVVLRLANNRLSLFQVWDLDTEKLNTSALEAVLKQRRK